MENAVVDTIQLEKEWRGVNGEIELRDVTGACSREWPWFIWRLECQIIPMISPDDRATSENDVCWTREIVQSSLVRLMDMLGASTLLEPRSCYLDLQRDDADGTHQE